MDKTRHAMNRLQMDCQRNRMSVTKWQPKDDKKIKVEQTKKLDGEIKQKNCRSNLEQTGN